MLRTIKTTTFLCATLIVGIALYSTANRLSHDGSMGDESMLHVGLTFPVLQAETYDWIVSWLQAPLGYYTFLLTA